MKYLQNYKTDKKIKMLKEKPKKISSFCLFKARFPDCTRFLVCLKLCRIKIFKSRPPNPFFLYKNMVISLILDSILYKKRKV